MITTYSKPTKPHIWSYFVGVIYFLGGVALIGNVISGVTEINILSRLIGEVVGQYTAYILAFLLAIAIEVVYSIFTIMATKSWFEIRRLSKTGNAEERQDIPKLMYIAVFSTVIALLVIILSIGVSTEGKTDLVEDMITMPDSLRVDSTLATQMTATATLQLGSDTLAINAAHTSTVNEETARVNKLITSKKARLTQLKNQAKDYPNSTWYPQQIKKNETDIKSLRQDLREFKTTKEAERVSAINTAISTYLSKAAAASDTLRNVIANTQAENTTLFNAAIKRKSKIQNIATWFVVFGILARMIHAIVKYLGYYLSGRQPEHVENEADFALSNFAQFKEGVKAHWYNLMNTIVVGIIGKEIQLKNSRVIINKANTQAQALALAEAERELLQREKEALELQQKQETEKLALQQEKEALEKAKAEMQQEEAERKIKADAANKQLEAARREQLEKLKREKEQELAEAKRQQEKRIREEILKEQQQEIEREQQHLDKQQQEIPKQQQLLDKAKNVEAATTAITGKQRELEQELTTTLEQIATKSTTRTKTTQLSDIQNDVDSHFAKNTANNVIIIKSRFTTNVRQWYDRYKKSEVKLQQEKVAHRSKVEKSYIDNKRKYEYAVEKGAAMGLKIYYSTTTNRVEFEPIVTK